MKKLSISLAFLVTLASGQAQFAVSENGRYLLRDGKPFFWMADTGWELFHRLNLEQASHYLKRRAEQGFTVIQAVVLAEFDGLHTPNAYGELPLVNDDPNAPNEKYFQLVDYIIDKAAEYNLVIALLPTWGDKVFRDSWGKGPEIFDSVNAENYGKWIARRYANRRNIIWVLGGDRNPRNESDINIWRSMAKGIMEGAGPGKKPLISFHPQPAPLGSAEWFHRDGWLSFNMFQNGHCRYLTVYENVQAVYHLHPVKPVLDDEVLYEDHPVCFNAKDYGTSNAYDVRQYAYLDLFAGCCGHTYGCHDIWQFYSPHHEGVNGPHVYWEDALELPGANQMKFLKALIESHPQEERVPDQSLVEENNNCEPLRIQATRGTDYLMVYSAAGLPFTVKPGKISGEMLKAYWYNPRNGGVTMLQPVKNAGPQRFTPPTAGYGQDWVLVMDDASRHFPLPVSK